MDQSSCHNVGAHTEHEQRGQFCPVTVPKVDTYNTPASSTVLTNRERQHYFVQFYYEGKVRKKKKELADGWERQTV